MKARDAALIELADMAARRPDAMGFTADEIARATGRGRGTVGTVLRRLAADGLAARKVAKAGLTVFHLPTAEGIEEARSLKT